MYRRAPLRFDPSIYGRALVLLARNPAVIIVPLLAGVIAVAVSIAAGGGGILGSVTGGLTGFLVQLIQLWAFGVACAVAEPAWRRGRTSFDEGWIDARRRGGDILFAALGFTFIVSIAQYAGTIIGALGVILSALALYFFCYTIPAAAIGGIPGGAALQISIERVRRAPLPAAVLVVAFILLYLYAAPLGAAYVGELLVPLVGGSTVVAYLIYALFQAIAVGYLAFVAAKQYDDVAFG